MVGRVDSKTVLPKIVVVIMVILSEKPGRKTEGAPCKQNDLLQVVECPGVMCRTRLTAFCECYMYELGKATSVYTLSKSQHG